MTKQPTNKKGKIVNHLTKCHSDCSCSGKVYPDACFGLCPCHPYGCFKPRKSKPTKPTEMTKDKTRRDFTKKLEEILDKHFPDEMDSQMYHPNLPSAVSAIKELIREREIKFREFLVECSRKPLTKDQIEYSDYIIDKFNEQRRKLEN